MGFECPPGGNVADFLSSITVPSERKVRDGWTTYVPTTAEELEAIYRRSDLCKQMTDGIQAPQEFTVETEKFKATVQKERRTGLFRRNHSPYTAGLQEQVVACTIRHVWRIGATNKDSISRGKTANIAMQTN